MNAEITEAMLDGAKQVHFSFPTTITKDELLENAVRMQVKVTTMSSIW